jgi:hypothetical protein
MNSLKPTPASIRYLKARLKPFKNPLFWGSLAILTVVGYSVYQYWQHPELLEGNSDDSNSTNISASSTENSDSSSSLSSDDLAVGADIDNVQLLLTELERNQALAPSPSVNVKAQNGQDRINQNWLNQFKTQQEKTSQLSKASPQSQLQAPQYNLPKNNFLSDKTNLRGTSIIAPNNQNFFNSSSFKSNSSIGQIDSQNIGIIGARRNWSTNKYRGNNFYTSTPSTSPSIDLFGNLNAANVKNQVNLSDPSNLNNNSQNFSAFNQNNSYPIQPANPYGLSTGINQNQTSNFSPNYDRGISNNSQQVTPSNNLNRPNLNQYQTQLKANSNYNSYPNQNGYGYGATYYGAPPSNLNNTNSANSGNSYGVNNYSNYQAQPNDFK